MKAVVMSQFGGPEVLQMKEMVTPVIQPNQVGITVRAAGINRPDIFQRKGNYPAPVGVVANIPGLEVSGHIAEVGNEVEDLKVGDRVMALLGGGGYAEYAIADAECCIIIPDELSFEEAASLPENLFTVWHNVFERGQLTAGQKFLVHGGAGGIGYTAIQLAKAFGAKVFTTVSTAEKEEFVRIFGADHVVRYREEDFSELWKDENIDVILDSIGGDYFDKNIRVLKEDGHLVYINATSGAKVELNLFKLMQKRIFLTGSTLRARDTTFKGQLAREIENKVLPLLVNGQFRIQIDRIFPLDEAATAHAYMEAGQHIGKLVLVC
ncbi:MAG TPA: NAD(P)H-quinone oxidoreductase [Sphingobacterium sp.]|nr:NAD(P)H-quinone oxidoreductase [Sphingobacterium sp.]